ncbi:PTS system mannose/fructose/sorbose family transporter subunit IID, partial [Oenococcus oeni]
MATKTKYELTKKDFRQMNRRNIFLNQLGWNYEKMQGSGYLFIVLPQLRKIYGDHTPELKRAMRMQNQFFNTNPYLNTT